jgi:NADH-quinone oxidoreductase subunit J
MTILQIIFILLAAVTLGSAFMVVTARNLVHSALWLIATLFGVAVMFGLLQAMFLAVVQVVIYIGAIAILMIFAIMLTRKVATDSGPQLTENWAWGLVMALALFLGLGYMLLDWFVKSGADAPLPALGPRADQVRELGIALVAPNGFALAFELASVLLLGALIGAIYVAWEKKS